MNHQPENPLATYENNIEKLESLIHELESGNLRLEEALKQYEEGIKLVRQCQRALDSAEQKIQQLTQNQHGEETLIPFNIKSSNNHPHPATDEEKIDDNIIPF